MNRLLSNIVGAVVEAWAELRIHRTRVLLSLIGVAIAVAALTSVVGVGALAAQSTTESLERGSGRPATLTIYAYDATGQTTPDASLIDAAFADVTQRYSIDWATRSSYAQVSVQFADGVRPVETTLVDADYGTMHRVELSHGTWFTEADANRLAPAVIVNEVLWNQIGAPDLRSHPTVDLDGDQARTGVIIGVVPTPFPDYPPSMMMLMDGYEQVASSAQLAQLTPNYEVWVPPELAEGLTELLRRDIAGALGESWQVDVNRQDYLAYGGEDPLLPVKLVVGGVAVLILFLGALSLVNISLVTIRQRIREIGIRRSFGATAGRVFFAVMMESVVGTIAAGVVGVFIAVLVVQNPAVRNLIAQGATDLPAFPIEAALIGIGAATLVGALAGLLPALVAVRVKVIDAIRY